MRGAPQRGFAAAIFLIRAAILVSMRGRPVGGRRDNWVQYSRKRRRCHRRTVSGDTKTRACLQRVHTPARPAQNRRSAWAELRPGHCSLVDGELLTAGPGSRGRADGGRREGTGGAGARGAGG
jgi:hypothetical protein